MATRKRKTFEIIEDGELITEPAFKKRNNGLSFKDAGVAHLVEEVEVNEGVSAKGIVQRQGEEGVFKVRSRFANDTMKTTALDSGRPELDGMQGQANYAHLCKKADAVKQTHAESDITALVAQRVAAKEQREQAAASQSSKYHGKAGADDSLCGDAEQVGEAAMEQLLSLSRPGKPKKAAAPARKDAPTPSQNKTHIPEASLTTQKEHAPRSCKTA